MRNLDDHDELVKESEQRLLPTPETVNRKSRKAMTSSTDNGRRSGGGNSSPPGLAQVAELQEGRWPKDLPPYEQLPPATRAIVDSLMKGEPCPQSDLSSAGAEDSTSASTTQDSRSSGPAKTTRRRGASSTATGLPSLLPPMCERSTPDSLMSMCWPAGFPARISAKLAFVLALLSAPAPDSGMSSLAPFAFFDPASSSWKTSQGSLLPDSESLPPTWSRSGIWADGAASEQQMSALPTVASESSSLLPTPMSSERGDRSQASLEKGGGKELRAIRKLLPTPVAKDDGKSPEAHRQMKANLPGGARTSITSLAVLARADFVQPAGPLLPTPTGDDANNVTRESGDFQSLAREANLLMPTPSARDRKGKSARDPHRSDNGKLRSDQERPLSDLEDLLPTGASTPAQSRGGKNSPAALPGQLTIEDA